MPDDNVGTVKSVISELWDKGNPSAVDKYFAEGFADRSPGLPPQVTPDREGMKKFAQMYADAFPGKRVTVEDIVASGDKVAVRWTMRGTHEGELMGIPASNADVTLTGLTMYRFENGKVAEEWTYGDMLGLLQQVGAMPAMAQA